MKESAAAYVLLNYSFSKSLFFNHFSRVSPCQKLQYCSDLGQRVTIKLKCFSFRKFFIRRI